MNRVDFMSQLERLLQGIAPGERDEALQYYNDYFDDAGAENEQEVIEALGNPARVAENIKRDLLGSGYGGGAVPKAQASDRALVEYGKEQEAGDQSSSEDTGHAGSGSGAFGSFAEKELRSGEERDRFETSYKPMNDRISGDNNTTYNMFSDTDHQKDSYPGQDADEKPAEKAGMPPWAIALLITLLVFGSPLALGLLCVVFGIIVCWYALVLAAGVTAVALLAVLVVLVVTGILWCFVNPWVGMALVGGGLGCGGIGFLFLMVTVAMAGIVTPAFWRGVRRLFKRKRTAA